MKKRVISVLLAAGMIAGALAGCGGASGGAAAESGAAEDLPYSGVTPMIGTFGDTWTSQVLFLGDNYNVISENPTFAEDFTAGTAIQEQSLKSEVFL